jgi:hypothetical protein
MAIDLGNLLARVKHYRKDLHGGEHMYALQTVARRVASQALLETRRVTLDTVVGQNIYDIPFEDLNPSSNELTDVEIVRIQAVYDSLGNPLREINPREAGQIHRFNITEVGTPSRWGDNMGMLLLDPTPEAIITLTVDVYVCPNINAETVNLPHQAEDCIVAGALYELMAIPGEGFNPQLVSLWAQRWTKEFTNYIGLITMGTSDGQMHISSQYMGKTRAGSYGVGGWMRG